MAGKKQMISPQIPETLVWFIKLVIVIPRWNFFFPFPRFPVSSSGLCVDCLLCLFCLFSCVFYFPSFFLHLFSFWKVPFIVLTCALTQTVTWSNHTHCCLVLLFPHMLSFGISPLPPDFWLHSVHLALPWLPFRIWYTASDYLWLAERGSNKDTTGLPFSLPLLYVDYSFYGYPLKYDFK